MHVTESESNKVNEVRLKERTRATLAALATLPMNTPAHIAHTRSTRKMRIIPDEPNIGVVDYIPCEN